MSTTLQKTIERLYALPEDKQAAIVEQLGDMISRATIDMKLTKAESRGGKTSSDVFFAKLRSHYGG